MTTVNLESKISFKFNIPPPEGYLATQVILYLVLEWKIFLLIIK